MFKYVFLFLLMPSIMLGMETREAVERVMRGFDKEHIAPAEYRARLQFCASLLRRVHGLAHNSRTFYNRATELSACQARLQQFAQDERPSVHYSAEESRWRGVALCSHEESAALLGMQELIERLLRECPADRRAAQFDTRANPLMKRFGTSRSFCAALLVGKESLLTRGCDEARHNLIVDASSLRAVENPLVAFDFDEADFALVPFDEHEFVDKADFVRDYVRGINAELLPFVQSAILVCDSLRVYGNVLRAQSRAHALDELVTTPEDRQLLTQLAAAWENYHAQYKAFKRVYAALRAELAQEIARDASDAAAQNVRDIFAQIERATTLPALPDKI